VGEQCDASALEFNGFAQQPTYTAILCKKIRLITIDESRVFLTNKVAFCSLVQYQQAGFFVNLEPTESIYLARFLLSI
jgi:hypothetical protein